MLLEVYEPSGPWGGQFALHVLWRSGCLIHFYNLDTQPSLIWRVNIPKILLQKLRRVSIIFNIWWNKAWNLVNGHPRMQRTSLPLAILICEFRFLYLCRLTNVSCHKYSKQCAHQNISCFSSLNSSLVGFITKQDKVPHFSIRAQLHRCFKFSLFTS